MITLLTFAKEMKNIGPTIMSEINSIKQNSLKGDNNREFLNILANYDQVLYQGASNLGRISSGLNKNNGRIGQFLKGVGEAKKNTKLVIQGPLPDDIGTPWPERGIGTFKIAEVSLMKGEVDLELEMGAKSIHRGRVIDFGFKTGKQGTTQFVRMDWHNSHKSKTTEEYWVDDPYHFHLNN